MNQFINKKEALVNEAIDGMLSVKGTLARLDGYPHIRVVVRTDQDKSKVALISGGGSGHEPAHAGFVGEGMLTAAVCGEVFASPSVEAVLAAILAVTGDAGCLLIVKNYTGDRLNFGLAAERAKSQGLKVNMIVVGDDIALPELAQPRGVGGTLFVHKIAGAAAAQGASLNEVTELASKVGSAAMSLGMSLDTCTVPGSAKEQRLAAGHAELGLGIHGEPGAEQIAYTDACDAMRTVCARLQEKMDQNSQYTALLNNLGGATPLEMAVLAKELMDSAIGSQITHLIGPAPMMTSLDMRGFSVSLLPNEGEFAQFLQQPCAPTAWPGCLETCAPVVLPVSASLAVEPAQPSADQAVAKLIDICCEVAIAMEDDLNALDAKIGDGDTGSTLAGAARALLQAKDKLPMADPVELYRAIGLELSQTMGGSSGALLAIFFAAAGDAASSSKETVPSLMEGLTRMKEVGGAELGDRTMIDALEPALHALSEGLEAAAKAARVGADGTCDMVQAKAGRAAYVNEENLKGNADPGAEAVARLFTKLAE